MKTTHSPHTKDMLWQIGKTAICGIQFWILFALLKKDALEWLAALDGEVSTLATCGYLLYPVLTAALLFVLWGYYDSIDDRGFNQVCLATETPKFLRDPAYILGIALTTLITAPALYAAFLPFFQYCRLGSGAIAVSLLAALAVAGGGSILRVSRLNYVWSVQKNLPHPKPPSRSLRIFYAAVFFVALLLIIHAVSLVALLMILILLQFMGYVLAVVGAMLLWCYLILPVLNIPARRRFMRRLQSLQEQGKLSVEIQGHPYLSLFLERIPFGLTVTARPHPDTKAATEAVYRATFANCKRRREIVILCEHNIYQFVYSLKFSHVARFSRMGANNARVRTVALPGLVRFTNHTFDFPEGEGARILLIDTPPTVLAVRGLGKEELYELDNASEVFGYTVYGKNSFLNWLERI